MAFYFAQINPNEEVHIVSNAIQFCKEDEKLNNLTVPICGIKPKVVYYRFTSISSCGYKVCKKCLENMEKISKIFKDLE